MRRLVVLSALFILVGLLLLLSSVPLWSLLINGSTSSGSSSAARFLSSASSTTDTTTIESLVGFGLVGVGLILEVLSLFVEVGGAAQGNAIPLPEDGEKT